MSPNQLIPSQPYTLSYYITDHTDSNTYYVRAVVYDAITGEVLDTQNLTQASTNSRLFSKRTNAPGDPSGHGRRIVVVATAYEDSGYVTKSSLYQEQSENYIIIKAGANGQVLGGGFGGVDYNVIKEIVVVEVVKVIKLISDLSPVLKTIVDTIKVLPTDRYNLEPLLHGLSELDKKISLIPVDNSIDLLPIITEVQNAIQAITDKEITPATDLTPLSDALTDLKEEINLNHDESRTILNTHIADLHTVLPGMIKENASQAIGKTKFNFTVNGGDEPPVQKEKKPAFDIKKLIGL